MGGLVLMNKPTSVAARLALTYRPVGDLIPDARNARTHSKRQIEQLRASIGAFGFTNPILADPDGRIIAGHGRFQAARAMGLAEVPTIILSGLSETQKRALRIADNKIALDAGWDLEILQEELGALASIDVDIDPTLTGFSTGEIDVILSSATDPDDEVIPPVPATPRTRPGDIWILGEHRVGWCDAVRAMRILCAGHKDWKMTSQEDDTEDSDVGYRRPPTTTRFTKGRSGNPAGRPRGRHRKAPYATVLGQMVTIREGATERRVTAAEAFLLQLAKRGVEGDSAAARASLAMLEEARKRQTVGNFPTLVVKLVGMGRVITPALEALRMAKKLDPHSKTARIALEPWLVEAALARLSQPLSPADQRTIGKATRTPRKVRWPEWWSEQA